MNTSAFTIISCKSDFLNPPASALTRTWWHWLDGKVTKEGIDADLDAMHAAGIGGVQVFEWGVVNNYPEVADMWKDCPMKGSVPFASDEWIALMRYAADKAHSYGMTFGAHNSAGCSSSGGPWVDEKHAMPERYFNFPATESGKGFESDKFRAEATEVFFKGYPAKLAGFCDELVIDSYEVGHTQGAPEHPQYTPEQSSLFCRNYGRRMRELANAAGMKLFIINFGNMPADWIDFGCEADVPMSEVWYARGPLKKVPAGWSRLPVSSAIRMGQDIVASETFTAWPDDAATNPSAEELKITADGSFCAGVNLNYLHTWVLNPCPSKMPRPKLLKWGTMFGDRDMKSLFDYIARCQSVLQKGKLVSATWAWETYGPKDDFTCDDPSVSFTHRKLDDCDVYFLASPDRSLKTRNCHFAVNGKTELWDPHTGSITQCNGNKIPFAGSVFVVIM